MSFLRLAAFTLAHAGLAIVVYALAATLRGVPSTSALVIILGNVVIIGLEGLIVTIQALRLEYYEFFSKFYQGGGEPYRPFALPLETSQPRAGLAVASTQRSVQASSRRPD
jgi:V/A-type H+-transporting ATPase subunit I